MKVSTLWTINEIYEWKLKREKIVNLQIWYSRDVINTLKDVRKIVINVNLMRVFIVESCYMYK